MDNILSIFQNEQSSHKFYTLVSLATAYLFYIFFALHSHMTLALKIYDWNVELKLPQKYIYSWKGVEISPVLPVDDKCKCGCSGGDEKKMEW